ncbi:CopG family nickel-responsive transcriptional regulator [Rhizobium aquaticum]|uniref:Putative nickel-responsive regulator n=1 Tax=Rhizobium aquaticum TaxID=1549636 RepID=A0ABV2IXX4_9HYPH
MQRVTVTLDDDLMAELDRVMAERGYQNRSEAIRDLARAGLKQARVEAGDMTHCVGVLSYTYDHKARDLARRLTNTFHDHHDISVASMHVHLDQDRCLEVSILKGSAEEVRHFAEHVTAERNVTHGELAIIPSS